MQASMIRKWLVLGLLAGLLVFAGCTQTAPVPAAPVNTATSGPTHAEPNITITEVTTTIPATTLIPTTTMTIVQEVTVVPPDPTNVSEISFVRYADTDFSLEYPQSWNVSKTTYNAYICTSNSVTRCFRNETAAIGPFDFNDNSDLKKPARIVTFTSADGNQKLVAFTSDFLDNLNGNYEIDPTFEWAKDRVTKNFPDVSGSAVGDYQYARSGNTMTSTYTVTMPQGSAAYPLAYTMKNYVTGHHVYEFAFISDSANIQKYRNLRSRIFASIAPNDQ